MLSTINTEGGFGNVTPQEARFLKTQEDNFINSRASLLRKNNNIDTSLYDKYNVKIGLRNKNGINSSPFPLVKNLSDFSAKKIQSKIL